MSWAHAHVGPEFEQALGRGYEHTNAAPIPRSGRSFLRRTGRRRRRGSNRTRSRAGGDGAIRKPTIGPPPSGYPFGEGTATRAGVTIRAVTEASHSRLAPESTARRGDPVPPAHADADPSALTAGLLVETCAHLAPESYVALDRAWQAHRDRFDTAVMVGHRLAARAAYGRAVRDALGDVDEPAPPLADLPAVAGASVSLAYGAWRTSLDAPGRALLARALRHDEPRLDVVAGAAEAARSAALALAAVGVLEEPLVATLREAWDRAAAGAGPWPDGEHLPVDPLPGERELLALVGHARTLDRAGWEELERRVARGAALDVLGETLRRIRTLAAVDPATAETHRRAKLLLVAALHRTRDDDPTSRDVLTALRAIEVATLALALRDVLPAGLVRVALAPVREDLASIGLSSDPRAYGPPRPRATVRPPAAPDAAGHARRAPEHRTMLPATEDETPPDVVGR